MTGRSHEHYPRFEQVDCGQIDAVFGSNLRTITIRTQVAQTLQEQQENGLMVTLGDIISTSGRATDSTRGSGRIPRKSYAEVIMNPGGKYPVVKGGTIGNGWLYRSLVATFNNHRNSEDVLNDNKEWISFWFSSLTPWSVDIVHNFGREIWLCCYGFPIHAWNLKTFLNITSQWSEVIQVEEDTIKGARFDVCKVKLFTHHAGMINQLLSLEVGFLSFTVRVAEEQCVYINNSCQDCLGCCHGKDVGMVTEGTLQQEEDEAEFEELSRASREVRKSADFLEEVIVPQVDKPTDEIPVIEESP
ncbi:hypothetical protein Dimus_024811 [Dionaea muscipula]